MNMLTTDALVDATHILRASCVAAEDAWRSDKNDSTASAMRHAADQVRSVMSIWKARPVSYGDALRSKRGSQPASGNL